MVVEQLIRPTGLIDPEVEMRPVASQVDDLLGEVRKRAEAGQRVLVTTLTKRMAEDLTEYFTDVGVRCRYLHADVETLERAALLRDLRRGEFDVLVGINLLREGLDLPEVSLVAVLDADKEGFLRSSVSLIQTIGRAARHLEGRVILYADSITGSMKRALDETNRRREVQRRYNEEHGITPQSVKRNIADLGMAVVEADWSTVPLAAEEGADYRAEELPAMVAALEAEMHAAAEALDFEKAAALRDRLLALKGRQLGLPAGVKGVLGSGAMAGAAAAGRLTGAKRPIEAEAVGSPSDSRRTREGRAASGHLSGSGGPVAPSEADRSLPTGNARSLATTTSIRRGGGLLPRDTYVWSQQVTVSRARRRWSSWPARSSCARGRVLDAPRGCEQWRDRSPTSGWCATWTTRGPHRRGQRRRGNLRPNDPVPAAGSS